MNAPRWDVWVRAGVGLALVGVLAWWMARGVN